MSQLAFETKQAKFSEGKHASLVKRGKSCGRRQVRENKQLYQALETYYWYQRRETYNRYQRRETGVNQVMIGGRFACLLWLVNLNCTCYFKPLADSKCKTAEDSSVTLKLDQESCVHCASTGIAKDAQCTNLLWMCTFRLGTQSRYKRITWSVFNLEPRNLMFTSNYR